MRGKSSTHTREDLANRCCRYFTGRRFFVLAVLMLLASCSLPPEPSTRYLIPQGRQVDFSQDVAECRARAEAAIAGIPVAERDQAVYDSYNVIVRQCLAGKGYQAVGN